MTTDMNIVKDLQEVNNPAMSHSTCSVLIPSYDGYADLWRPFFNLFWRYWADCPFPVYLGTNHLDFPDTRVNVLKAGHGRVWASRVREQVEQIPTPYVLFMLEDFFLRRTINTRKVLETFDTLQELDGYMIRLIPRPAPDTPIWGINNIGFLELGCCYRVSTQAAIWRKETLLHLLVPGESIWEFEMKGSVRSNRFATGFYGVYQPVLTYRHHVVERGKWFPWEARYFGAQNIECDFSKRETMATREAVRWLVYKSISLIFHLFPWKFRSNMRRIARYMLKKA